MGGREAGTARIRGLSPRPGRGCQADCRPEGEQEREGVHWWVRTGFRAASGMEKGETGERSGLRTGSKAEAFDRVHHQLAGQCRTGVCHFPLGEIARTGLFSLPPQLIRGTTAWQKYGA